MKRKLLLLLLLLPLVAKAEYARVDGIYYSFSGNEATVEYDDYSGNVVIPETITWGGKTYKVTKIGELAFDQCRNLQSIFIPKSITYIGYKAFQDCDGLKKVIIPDIAAWCGVTFEYDSDANPLYYSQHIFSDETTEIKQLVIPEGVKKINFAAFANCRYLTKITLPSTLKSIYDWAFYICI